MSTLSVRGRVQRFENGLDSVIKWISVTILAVLCVSVFVQVILRCVFGYMSRWSLEVPRYLMIWAVLLASGAALKHGNLVGVDIVIEWLQPRIRILVFCFGRAFMALFSVVVVFQALKLVQSQWEMNQLSPALEIPIALAYMAIPVGFVLYLLFLVLLTYKDLRGLGRR